MSLVNPPSYHAIVGTLFQSRASDLIFPRSGYRECPLRVYRSDGGPTQPAGRLAASPGLGVVCQGTVSVLGLARRRPTELES
jgi:hypothetical protein